MLPLNIKGNEKINVCDNIGANLNINNTHLCKRFFFSIFRKLLPNINGKKYFFAFPIGIHICC